MSWRPPVSTRTYILFAYTTLLTGRLAITGDLGHHRAHLLVTGCHQERRRPAVRLGADDREAGFGMRELLDAVRRDGAAGVQVRVDERRQRRRPFDGRVDWKSTRLNSSP